MTTTPDMSNPDLGFLDTLAIEKNPVAIDYIVQTEGLWDSYASRDARGRRVKPTPATIERYASKRTRDALRHKQICTMFYLRRQEKRHQAALDAVFEQWESRAEQLFLYLGSTALAADLLAQHAEVRGELEVEWEMMTERYLGRLAQRVLRLVAISEEKGREAFLAQEEASFSCIQKQKRILQDFRQSQLRELAELERAEEAARDKLLDTDSPDSFESFLSTQVSHLRALGRMPCYTNFSCPSVTRVVGNTLLPFSHDATYYGVGEVQSTTANYSLWKSEKSLVLLGGASALQTGSLSAAKPTIRIGDYLYSVIGPRASQNSFANGDYDLSTVVGVETETGILEVSEPTVALLGGVAIQVSLVSKKGQGQRDLGIFDRIHFDTDTYRFAGGAFVRFAQRPINYGARLVLADMVGPMRDRVRIAYDFVAKSYHPVLTAAINMQKVSQMDSAFPIEPWVSAESISKAYLRLNGVFPREIQI